MTKNSDAPRAPKIDFLNMMVERIDKVIDEGNSIAVVSGEGDDMAVEELLEEKVLVGWRDAFEWLAVFLENRRDYHKKRNTANKLELQLLEDALKRAGVDTAKIRKEAENAADDSIL
jgi:uridylate kinase